MALEELISTYGYAAVAVGTFLEGETVLILGGVAAHMGYLALAGVIAAAFLGTLAGDQLYFHLGRAKGRGAIERRPHWKARSERVFRMLERHQVWLILGYRFLYGLRTVIPFIIGAAGIPPLRFLLLDMVGVGIWAGTVGTLGYVFGRTLELIIGNIKDYQLTVFAALAALGVLVWGARMWWRRRLADEVAD